MQRNTLWPIVCVIGGKIFHIESQWVCLREPQPLLPFVRNRTPCQHSSQRMRFCFFIIRHLHQQSLWVAISIYVLKFWWINSPVSVCGKKKNIFFFCHVPLKTLAHFYTLLSDGLSSFSMCLNVCDGLCVCLCVQQRVVIIQKMYACSYSWNRGDSWLPVPTYLARSSRNMILLIYSAKLRAWCKLCSTKIVFSSTEVTNCSSLWLRKSFPDFNSKLLNLGRCFFYIEKGGMEDM